MMDSSGLLPANDIWPAIDERIASIPSYASSLEGEEEPKKRFWGTLKDLLDFALSTPRQIEEVESVRLTSASGQEYYILKNRVASTYIKLGPEDYFLWTLMDGTRNVKGLVVEYYKAYRSFAFSRIGSLVSQLREGMFLTGKTGDIYHGLTSQVENKTAAHMVNQLWKGFLQYELAIKGIDGFLTSTYKNGVFLLFSRPMQLLYILVSIYGMYAFYHVFRSGKYTFVQQNGSYVLGIVILIAINTLMIAVHEGAHAYTCKYYGRAVSRGGFIIYYGMPAFFVDTMDIWMKPKSARIMVSWAGPYSGIIMCGLCAIYMYHFPSSILNPVLFKIAYISFLGFFMNLDPLLELDGYFILMDWLEMPLLRRKSLSFIQTALLPKLKSLEKFSREDMIMTVYGLLAAVWSVVTILLSLYFWKIKFSGMIMDLWARGGATRYVLAAVVAVVIVAVVYMVGYKLLEYGRKLFALLDRTGFFNNIPYVFGALLMCAALLALLAPLNSGARPYLPYLQEIILLPAIFQAYLIQSFYKNSYLQSVFRILAVGLLSLFLSGLSNFIPPFPGHYFFTLVFGMAFFGAVILIFADNDLKTCSRAEKAILLAGCALAFLAVIPVFLWGQGGGAPLRAGESAIISGIVLLYLLTFVLLVFNITAYSKTGFEYAWALLAASLVINVLLNLAPLGASYYLPGVSYGYGVLQLLSTLSVSAGVFLYWHILQRIRTVGYEDEIFLASTEKEILTSVFGLFYRGLFNNFKSMWGKRHAGSVEDELNRFSVAARYDLGFSNGKVEGSPDRKMDIIDLAEMYRELLDKFIADATRLAGSKIIKKTLVSIYDRLYWQKREVADHYLLTGMGLAAPKTTDGGMNKDGYESIFNRIPLFSELDADRLKRIQTLFRVKTFYPADNIITFGETGDKFYVIKAGKVDVIVPAEGEEQVVAELSTGDFFGEIALLKDVPRTATVRAKTLVEVFVLERSDFKKLTAEFEDLDGKFRRGIESGNIVRKMPLFNEFTGEQINSLISRLFVEKFARGSLIIRQGDKGDNFYIIKSGQVEVLREDEAGRHTTVAHLGAGEYVGEIALLLDVPRTATVRALEDSEMLVLRKKDFNELFGESIYFMKNMEQVSTRRLYDLEQKTGVRYLHQ